MAQHKLYREMVKAVGKGALSEPFSAEDVRQAYKGFADRTYGTFLPEHRLGNGNTSELFERVSPARYKLLRPFKASEVVTCSRGLNRVLTATFSIWKTPRFTFWMRM